MNLFELPSCDPQITVTPNSTQIKSKVRLNTPIRNQVEIRTEALDDLLPDDHKARFIWDYVNQLNLDEILNTIKAVENNPGRPATDPRILFALWILAITEGIGSARMIERYSNEHIAFKWICGTVPVNYHTISDFRTKYGKELDKLLTESIAILMHSGLVTLKRVSQDGMKVKADAGKGSFRKEDSLKDLLNKAKEQIDFLNREMENNPSECSERLKAARKRAAEERINALQDSIKELKKYREEKEESFRKERKKLKKKQKDDMKISVTDSQARIMKMNNSGFSPAYNVQLATDHKKRAIVGVKVVNNASDYGQLVPMLNQLKNRLGRVPDEFIADSGYFSHESIEKATKAHKGCKLYIKPRNTDSHNSTEGKSKVVIELEKRMATDEVKPIYNERASTAEWANAVNRNRGLSKFFVRGLEKAQAMVCLFAIVHNMLILYNN